MIEILEEKGGCVKYIDENGEETWLKKELFYKKYKDQIEEPKSNPQISEIKSAESIKSKKHKYQSIVGFGKDREEVSGHQTISDGKRYPKNLIRFNRDKEKLHSTQKPVSLCEYLIKTYTNEGMLVLDNCIGSGTTALACKQLGRNFIGFEISKEYCEIANKRIEGIKRGSN